MIKKIIFFLILFKAPLEIFAIYNFENQHFEKKIDSIGKVAIIEELGLHWYKKNNYKIAIYIMFKGLNDFNDFCFDVEDCKNNFEINKLLKITTNIISRSRTLEWFISKLRLEHERYTIQQRGGAGFTIILIKPSKRRRY